MLIKLVLHMNRNCTVFQLLRQLENEAVASICAEGFKIILEDTPGLLNSTTHANIKLMYRQRFFIETVPALIEGFNGARSGT